MRSKSYEVVICGAGIAGISAAYFLSVRYGVRKILLIDERDPLSLTSDKSTECYRNWWPGPGEAMVALMNRSIDLMESLAEESNNIFHLNRRGYLYVTGDPTQIALMQRSAQEISALGAGPLRIHDRAAAIENYQPSPPEGYRDAPNGADLISNARLLHTHFPYLSERAVGALHVRRAGWFSAQQLGAYLLEQARAHGIELRRARLTGMEIRKNRVRAVILNGNEPIKTERFVNAAGPFAKQVGRMMAIELPIYTELHLKTAFRDYLGIVPRHAPLLIWKDPQFLSWTQEERLFLSKDPETSWLLEQMPAGVHTRPEGTGDSQIILLLWEYHTKRIEPLFPPPLDPQYPELALRGLATMLPGLERYLQRMPKPSLDGGYYTRTLENRPLIGPLPVKGAYINSAYSGFGLMAACAGGELLAAHLTGSSLPPYASAFVLERYSDPNYQQQLSRWSETGQL